MNIKFLFSAFLLGCVAVPVDATVASAAPIGVAAAADDAVETGSLAINMATGSFTITNPSNSYATRWASTQTEPKVEVDCGVNNMDVKNSDDNTIMAYVGGKNSCDYVLSVSKGWVITGYSFDVALVNAAKPVMLVAGENTVQATTTPERVTVNGLCENNFVGFTLYGDNNAVLITNWTISYKTDPNAAPALDLREKKVFENVAGGVPYRIPAIGKAGNGDIIAVADSRPSHADIGSGRVDLHLRRSTDNGKTWGEVLMPENFRGDGKITSWRHDKAAYGDPCIVGDRESGRMMITSCSGFPGFFDSSDRVMGWARWYSYDNGVTWEGPQYIEQEFVYKPLDEANHHINGFFIGAGKIHQSNYIKKDKYYRLYCAGSSQQGGGNTENWVLYSDDFGETWDFLGGAGVSPVPHGDEPKVEELPDGNVIVSSRHVEGRRYNIYKFSSDDGVSGSWGEVALSSTANHGLKANNGCNGEIQIVPVVRKDNGEKAFIALQSLPTYNRTKVSIFYKDITNPQTYATPADFARDWDGYYQVSNTTSAYSTWCLQDDHTLGFLYEENSSNDGYDIVYKRLGIDVITNGKYEFDTEFVYTPKKIDFAKAERIKTMSKLITTVENEVASRSSYVLGDKLIKDVNQLSCPFKYQGTTSSDRRGLDALIDNNASTFFHTDYSGGNVTPGKHYLDVTSVSGTAFEKEIQINVTRRADGVADHPSEFTITGSNGTSEFTPIAVVEVPDASAGAKATCSFDIPNGESYTQLRFAVTKTPLMRGYWHMAEFQLYPRTLDPECKNAVHPDAYKKIMQAIADAKNAADCTEDDLGNLQKAYDDYLAVVDNSTAISEIEYKAGEPAYIYDLQGRRVNAARKGIYIINGKKVVK